MPSKIKRSLEPCIDELMNGDIRVRVRVKSRTGERKQRTATRVLKNSSIKEARAMVAQLRRELEQEDGAESQARLSLSDYALDWLAERKARLKPKTYEVYEFALLHRILPEIGDIYLDALTRKDIEGWVIWAEAARMDDERPYAQDTVRGWWRVLKTIAQDAAADHGLTDPTLRVRPPSTHVYGRRERKTLSRAQLTAMLSAMQATYPGRWTEMLVLATTGMRAGELYGLRWEDVDERQATITISQAVSAGQLTDTKTHIDRRVPLLPHVAAALRAHRREQIATQHPGLALGLVFPSDVGTPRQGVSLSKYMTKVAKAIGLRQRVTPQVLRRTLNTLLIEQGISEIIIRAQMGHVTDEMTEHYAGVRDDSKASALTLLFGASGTPEGTPARQGDTRGPK